MTLHSKPHNMLAQLGSLDLLKQVFPFSLSKDAAKEIAKTNPTLKVNLAELTEQDLVEQYSKL